MVGSTLAVLGLVDNEMLSNLGFGACGGCEGSLGLVLEMIGG
jgi:hypothetical protein